MLVVRETLLKEMTSIEDSAELINFFFYFSPLGNQSMLIKKKEMLREGICWKQKY